jgi:hypothetical protein
VRSTEVRKVACNCGHSFEAQLPESIDIDKEPERWQEILCGDFMSVKCPNCGHPLKPDLPFRLTRKSFDLDLYYVPERDRRKALAGELPYSISDAKELVVGYPELVERLSVMEGGLDFRAIEVLKYYLLRPALDDSEGEEEIRIRFKEKMQDELVFYIEGMKEDEIAVSRIAIETYNKVMQNLEDTLNSEPFSTLLSPPYISINKIYSED